MGIDRKKADAYAAARAELTASLTLGNSIASALQTCEEPSLKESLKVAERRSNVELFLALATYNRIATEYLEAVSDEVQAEQAKRKTARTAKPSQRNLTK